METEKDVHEMEPQLDKVWAAFAMFAVVGTVFMFVGLMLGWIK